MPTFTMEQYSATLLDITKYRWVSTLVGSDVAPVRNARHSRWQPHHTHHHRHREILIGLSGRAVYGWRDKIYSIIPGTVMCFDSDEQHDSWYPSFGPPCCHLWLHEVTGNAHSTLLWNLCMVRNRRFVITPSVMPATPVALLSAGAFWKSWDRLGKQPRDLVCRARFVASFAAMILDLYDQSLSVRPDEQAEERNRREVVMKISEVIKHDLGGDLSLEHLSRLAGYSRFHFLRLFAHYQGCTLHRYIQQLKLLRAMELLHQGMKAAAISEALGFANPSSLTRFFRRQTGKRPSDYFD